LKKFVTFLFFISFLYHPKLWSQDTKQVVIESSDFLDISESEVPGAIVFTGNVSILHEGIRMTCNKAYHFTKDNFVKAFGNVALVQGDTLTLLSKYAEYNGNTKMAMASGNVQMQDPKMTLVTEVINFNRNTQEAFYDTNGTIKDAENTLISKSGRYFLRQKKFKFEEAVTITTPRNVIKTNHLDYFTNTGYAYMFGPSTITAPNNSIYTEKGFYDTKKDLAKFVKNSKIKYKERLIQGDDLYYDRKNEFARAINNVKITDSINKVIIKGHYAEVYREKDSMFVTKKALALTIFEKDSVFFHAKRLLITGKPENRIIRGYNNARFLKKDMSGKCDSIHYNQKTGLTKMLGKPVFWNGNKQMTGDIMHLISDTKLEQVDSLKVLNNAFIISKDTIDPGYNQVKGQNLYGKFEKNKLHIVDVIKNAEIIYYMRNDKQDLVGINKNVSSSINMVLEKNEIQEITFFKSIDGAIYPEANLPENARKLKGFLWRGEEQILKKEDIFPAEELELDKIAQKESKANSKNDGIPMEPGTENLESNSIKKSSLKNKKPTTKKI
jgi:lipopolysaccharide export system protein LptA